MKTRNVSRQEKSIVAEKFAQQCLPLETCRICLKRGKVPIFGQDDMSKDVMEFGGIEISYDDEHPQHMCHPCLSLLEAAMTFRKTAKISDEILRKGFKDDSSQFSDDDYIPDSHYDTDNESTIKREYLEYKDFSESDDEPLLKCEPVSESETNIIDTSAEIQDATGKIKEKFIEPKDSVCNESFMEEEYLEYEDSSEPDHDFDQNVLLYEPESVISDDMQETADNEDFNIECVKEVENPDTDSETVMIIVSEPKKCERCDVAFENEEELEKHNTEKHPIIPPNHKQCDICQQSINKKNYNSHIRQHREKYKEKHEKKYGKVECEICGKQVNKSYHKTHLKLHGTAEEQAERFVDCTLCNKTFSTHYFSDHMKRVHDKITFKIKGETKQKTNDKQSKILIKCPICDKNIKEAIYKEHLAKHGGPKRQYICDQCGKVFKHPSAFKTHTLIHGSDLKYQCQFCPYRGLHLGLLKVHVRTHTGDYNYKCSECPAKFITKSNLTKHCQRHKGLCKFKCDTCSKGFYSKRDVDKHIKTVHLGLKNTICDICGKGFGHRDNMLSHQLKVHKRKKISDKRGRLPSYLTEKHKKKT